MDIRNWGLDKVMQLPDWCFGRRWPIFCRVTAGEGSQLWDISELKLPDVCVVWEFGAWIARSSFEVDTFRLALGRFLPATAAQMDALEPLFNGLGAQGPGPRQIDAHRSGQLRMENLRMPVQAQGKNLILEATEATDKSGTIQVYIVISSIPTEVPDWLALGQA